MRAMNLSRREFLAVSSATVALGPDALRSLSAKPELRLGLITDVHYAETETSGTRFYRESLKKVQEPARLFTQEKLDRIVEMGDLIDSAKPATPESDLKFLKTINDELVQTGLPRAYVLGNHCLNTLDKATFMKTVGQAASHARFDHHTWTVVCLDACFRTDRVPYNAGNYEWTDTFIPDTELDWLRDTLKTSGDHVIVFAHQRLDLEPSDAMAVKNCPQVRQILEDAKNVRAVFQGHNHVNDLKRIQGLPYATVQAVVEGSGPENNAYSILNLHADGTVRMVGYRKHAEHPWAVKPQAKSRILA